MKLHRVLMSISGSSPRDFRRVRGQLCLPIVSSRTCTCTFSILRGYWTLQIAQLEPSLKETAIFATNTSALPIGDVAKAAKRPENVVGMHYFSPVEKMPLLEVIPHAGTSKEVGCMRARHRRQLMTPGGAVVAVPHPSQVALVCC